MKSADLTRAPETDVVSGILLCALFVASLAIICVAAELKVQRDHYKRLLESCQLDKVTP